jgi:MFS transporter, UMF1 family
MKLKIDRRTQIVQGDKKVIRAWIMYDWSNSVYQLTVLSVVFPVFYEKMTSAGGTSIVNFFGFNIINSVLYSWAIALSYLVVALFSPFFSSIADYTGRRRAFMRFFTLLGATSCGLMYFFNSENIEFGVTCFVLATIGYTGSLVFYNSFLPVIAPPEDQDRISANGFAMGYLGGVVLLLFNLGMILKPDFFGITDKTLPARISFVTVAVWWVGFSLITFFKLPRYTLGHRSKKGKTLLRGYEELKKVFAQVMKMPQLKVFLFAYLFMTMGVLNVMFMSAIYGKKELLLNDQVLIPIILLIQLVGMVGAWTFVRISKRIGNIRALILSMIGWVLVVYGAFLITDALGFTIVAFFVGLVMGGSQSLARSTYSKMIPVDTHDHTSFFSFYDVMEKLATVIGTFSFGIIEAITGDMRMSVLAVDAFFFIALLLFVRLFFLKRKELRVMS